MKSAQASINSTESRGNAGLPPPSKFRRYWRLQPGTILLNHGAFGACPKPILDLQTPLREQIEAEPVQFLSRRYEDRLRTAPPPPPAFLPGRPPGLSFVP